VAERERENGQESGAVFRRGLRRGLIVLGCALLFRMAMLASGSFGRPADLLRVDILNCIAAALMLVAIALAPGTTRGRTIAAFGLAAAIALATPLAWDGPLWKGWPVPLAGYVTGRVPDALFPVFPWAGFATLGAGCGVLLAHARSRGKEGAAVAWMAAAGAAAIPAGLLLDRYGPTVYPRYDFWYTSPAYFVLKAGVVLVVVGAAYLLDRVPGPSALRQLGRTSLLIYWLHLEVAYGKWVAPGARGSLPIEDAAWGVAALILAMFAVSLARTGVGDWRLRRRELVKA
jgi:hypothetical protein